MYGSRAFWQIFICFSFGTAVILYAMGVFSSMGFGGAVILSLSFLAVAYFIKRWVKENW